MPRVAFFDLDRTVLSVNSATGWLKRELRLGYLGKRQALHGAWQIGKYQLGVSRMEQAIEDAVATLQGEVEDELRQRTFDFYRQDVAHCVRPGARATVQAHVDQGDVVVLLTSSSNYMCEAVAADLPFVDWGCNRFEVQDGLFTGRALKPLCFGPGKVEHARRLAEAHGSDLAQCVFYTDSYSDLAPLMAVGEPVVVHPDPRLAREAKRRGWRVVDWGA